MFDDKYKTIMELTEEEKSKVDSYRKIDTMEIVKLLGEKSYPSHVIESKTNKKRIINNPIDYLKYVQGMTFAGAIKFMIDNLSEERTMKTITNRYKDVEEIPQAIIVKQDLIKKQFQALGNPAVRVTVKKTIDTISFINPFSDDQKIEKENCKSSKGFKPLTKGKKKEEEFQNVNQILQRIPYLNKLNGDGYNIYITPIEYENCDNYQKFIYFLIDDLREDKNPGILKKMQDELGEPNLLLESSKNNFQAVYLMENTIDYSQTKKQIENQRKIIHGFFRYLNLKFGDEKISGLRHPFRLAGFGNHKPEHQGEFVKLIHANFNAKNNIQASYKVFEAQALAQLAQIDALETS